jgi:hypothetical protein
VSIDDNFIRQNQQGLFRKSGQRTDECLNTPLCLEMIKTADCGEDTLANFTADLAVLDDLQMLVLPGLFDSCKHRVLPY